MKNYLFALLALVPCLSYAQATWTNSTDDEPQPISVGANWSTGVLPSAGSAIIIGVSSWLGFDSSLSVSTLTLSPGVSTQFIPLGSDTVTIGSGGLVLGAGSNVSFDLPVISSANSTWSIGGASVAFRAAFDISAGTVSLNLSNGGLVNFASSVLPNWVGTLAITGTGNFSVSASAFAPANLDKVTINGNPVQLSGGQLVAIPEPASFAALAGGMVLVGALTRRRR